jgi:pimeloyl-ACP methyl ester carboxylesterase
MTPTSPPPVPAEIDLTALQAPQLHRVQCAHPGGLHRMAYWQWGEPAGQELVILAHGLTRNGRDFDVLADRLAKHFCVVAPDFAGRGQSDWLDTPMLYQFPQYVADMVTLVARLGVKRVHWVGTSMGGLIGMLYASMKHHPISRFVYNDVGPVVAQAGRDRIASYVGQATHYPSFETAEAALRGMMMDFGPHSDSQFRTLSRHYLRATEAGWTFSYDPAISVPIKAQASQPSVSLWPLYEAFKGPTLVLRGQSSDILDIQTAQAMTQTGPRARLVEFAGVGHAPTLIADDQIQAVEQFLLGHINSNQEAR